jgi:uncharacterized membrane protein HdeD (DUF308 family)
MIAAWWGPVARGVLAILFGIGCFTVPSAALVSLAWFFGTYAMLDGIANVAALATDRRQDRPWWTMAVGGVAGILAGVLAFAWPGITAYALLFLIAARAFVTGVTELIAAVQLEGRRPDAWLLAAAGALSVGAGVAMALVPAVATLAIVWVIGIYAVTFGIAAIAFGLTLRNAPAPGLRLRHTMAPEGSVRELEHH